MKKLLLAMAEAGLLLVGWAATASGQEAPTFSQIWRTGASQEKQDSIQTASLLFRVTEEGAPETYIMVQTARPGKIRFDMTYGKDVYAAVLNGGQSWSWSLENSTVALDKANMDEIELDAAIMFVNYGAPEIFKSPRFVKEEKISGEVCLEYETTPIDDADQSFHFWVSKATRLPVRSVATGNLGTTAMFFRDYREVDGVKLPGTVQMADEEGTRTLTLEKAVWNPELPSDRFDKPTQALSSEWAEKILTSQQKNALTAARKKAVGDMKLNAEIEALKHKIRRLELEIEAEKNTLTQLETQYRKNWSDVNSVTMEPAVTYRSYWRHGYRYYRVSGQRRAARQLIRQVRRDNKQVAKDYEEQNQRLLNKRLELEDLQTQLSKLTALQQAE